MSAKNQVMWCNHCQAQTKTHDWDCMKCGLSKTSPLEKPAQQAQRREQIKAAISETFPFEKGADREELLKQSFLRQGFIKGVRWADANPAQPRLSDRCPCGGIILADTEDWPTPLCSSCFIPVEELLKLAGITK